MKTRILIFTLFALSLGGMRATAAPTGLDGTLFALSGCSPDLSSCSSLGSASVGGGVEFPAGGFSIHDIDLSTSTISFAYAGVFNTTFLTSAFNGFVLTDVNDTLGDITSVAFSSGVGYMGGNTPGVSWDADNIFVNFSGIFASGDPPSMVVFDVTTAAVSDKPPTDIPAPTPLALLLLGLTGLGAAARNKAR